ncbi:MAG: HAMP domain-containing sensor histidine kinase [Bacteroidetes bacterium]|nr:HAMP domain-containing sensor histidine kinase [Bacteroidota bacterium]MDA0860825.1 HAMP domain-containing sensor histidine kinase [Bacteroidota bacterium]MDA1318788.1 HAMP domain-containing sensor histidine kinase [Bacteroidota bacterium]
MKLSSNRSVLNWIIILVSFLIVSLIMWNTYRFFQKFKEEERVKMENFSAAQIELSKTQDLNGNISEFPLKIIQSNTTTPMIIVDSKGFFQSNNIDLEGKNSQQYLQKLSEKFAKENPPLEVVYDGEVLSTLYYGNSILLNKLKYYPMALVLIILLFAGLIYFFYRSSRSATQNKLWTAMAKETAHQIGTPLSSLIGWAELLKNENVNSTYIDEINNDIQRLETITERFSKIGSIPQLAAIDIVTATQTSIQYLQSRSSQLVHFDIKLPATPILVQLNEELYNWTIENLVKNGIDAMKGKGQISLELHTTHQDVIVEISDRGSGIPKKQFKTIFETGYTTKKRGWGLGLSLAKRIVEQYHNGKIKVLSSEIGKGTTIQITLKKITES